MSDDIEFTYVGQQFIGWLNGKRPDTDLLGDYTYILEDELDLTKCKIKLFREFKESAGVFKDLSFDIEELETSLNNLSILLTVLEVYQHGELADLGKYDIDSDGRIELSDEIKENLKLMIEAHCLWDDYEDGVV